MENSTNVVASTVKVASAATCDMWLENESKIKKAVAKYVFNPDEQKDVLSRTAVMFFDNDGAMDGSRIRGTGECVSYICNFLILEASRKEGFTAPRQLQGKKGANTKARALAIEDAKQNATSSLDLKIRTQEIEDHFNPRTHTNSLDDLMAAGSDFMAPDQAVTALRAAGEYNEKTAALSIDPHASDIAKNLTRALSEGRQFSDPDLCAEFGVNYDSPNRPRDFRRILEAAMRPVERHINAELVSLGLAPEARFNTASTGTRMSAAEAIGFAPSNVIFADFAAGNRPSIDLKIIDQAITSVTALLSNECSGLVMGQVVGL